MKFPMRHIAGASALSAALLAAHARPAAAQQNEIDVLRQQIAELQQRLEKIEADQKTQTTAATKAAGTAVSAKSPVTVSGLLQVHSLNFLDEDVNNGGNRGRDTFRLRRGEIRLTAPRITDRISGTVMFDPAKNTSISNNAIRNRDNILQEIQLSYLLGRTERGSNYVDVGQFKIPIGYESLLSSGALQTVERALMFTQRDPFDGGYGDVRDTGIQLRGTYDQLEYRLGIFNGIGDRQNGLALSDNKAVLARLSYRPRGVEGLEIGVSGGRGNTGISGNVGNPPVAVTPRAERDLLNFFAVYKRDKLTLQTEYLEGDAAPISTGGGTLTGRDLRGYYGHVGYLLNPKLEATLRYDYLDTDRDRDDADVTDITLGLNYYISGTNAKIQTNLVKRSGNDNVVSRDLRNDRLELRTNFQVTF